MYQQEVVHQIGAQFGEQFVYYNDNGNLAIDAGVLREFRKLTPDKVVWHRRERYWRFKEPGRSRAAAPITSIQADPVPASG